MERAVMDNYLCLGMKATWWAGVNVIQQSYLPNGGQLFDSMVAFVVFIGPLIRQLKYIMALSVISLLFVF